MLKAFIKCTKSVSQQSYISPFLTKGIFHKATYNKDKMVHCISKNHCFSFSEDQFRLSKQSRSLCGISSGSLLFAKVPIKGYSGYKGLKVYE